MCPGDHTLHLFVSGNLDSAELGGVRVHVETCAHCQQMVVALGKSEAWPPQQLDEYELHHLLGKGAMGEVYLARDTRLDRRVAIKFLVAADAVAAARLLREARSIARVQHPNVVAVYRVGEVHGRPYLVSELVDGQTLADLKRPMPPEQAVNIGAQILRGLAAAHRQQVLHRDLKLHNVMLTKEGVAKLVDFGLAKAAAQVEDLGISATDVRVTQTGAIVGTPRYLSPELWSGGEATVQSDLYAVGTMLYELLSGSPPHEAETMVDLRAQVLSTSAAPLRQRAPSVPERLCAVIDRCLAKDASERFDSAAALERALTHPPATARRKGLALTAALVACAAGAGAWWAWQGLLPTGERTLAISCSARAPADAWLGEAACGLARRAWCEPPQPYRCDAGGNVALRLAVERLSDGVALTLEGGPAGGRLSLVATQQADSVVRGLELLAAPVRTFTGARRALLPPSQAEVAAARQVGAASVDSYRSYLRTIELALGTVHVDEERIDAQLEELEKLDPGWAHPWVMHLIQLKALGDRAGEVLAAARRGVSDPERDPAGNVMLDALETVRQGRLKEAAASLVPVFQRSPDDPVLGFLLFKLLYYAHEPEDATAVARRLNEQFPELQFGGDLASVLVETGRGSELERLAATWRERAPANEQALTLQIALAVEKGDRARVRSLGADRLLLHSGTPFRWLTLSDALIAVGALEDAHALVDRLVAQPGLDHARGLSRAGILAILEGRFLAAEHALSQAIAPPDRGTLGESPSLALDALCEVQQLLGKEAEAQATRTRLAEHYVKKLEPEFAAMVRYEAKPCSPLEPLAEEVPEGPAREEAWVALRRAAAAAGCGDCKAVLRAGFSVSESSTRSLVDLGRCAVREGQLATAEDAFKRAIVFSPSLAHGLIRYSPVQSAIARFQLAQVLEAGGKTREALGWYDEFLANWSGAEAQVPEVKQAKEAVARLRPKP